MMKRSNVKIWPNQPNDSIKIMDRLRSDIAEYFFLFINDK